MTATVVAPYRIHHVAINVTDLQRSIDFYSNIIGLSVTDHADHSAKLSIGDTELTLFQLPPDVEMCGKDDPDHTGRLNHVAFEIPPSAFDIYHKRLLNHDVKITFGPVKRRHGYALYFLDPDGNKIEIFYYTASRNVA